jgi:hypothetical protein
MSFLIFAKIVASLVCADFAGGYIIKAAKRKVEDGYYGEALSGATSLITIIIAMWI